MNKLLNCICKEECGNRIKVMGIECCLSQERVVPYQSKATVSPEGEKKYHVCSWNYKKLQKTG